MLAEMKPNGTAAPVYPKKQDRLVKAVRSDAERVRAWIARGRHERFLVETDVTPDMARVLLENNHDNRVLNIPAVETYAAAMRRGEWMLNGQTIIVASTGELNDGQTRLHAVIDADMPVPMGIQFGLPRDSRATLDVGRKRTLGDHFQMAGLPNGNQLAATARRAWCYDNAIYSFSTSPTVEQAFVYVRNNPSLGEHLSMGGRVGSEFSTSGSEFAFATFVCGRSNPTVARELLERVHDGLGLDTAGHPAARVRERLLQHVTGRAPLRRNEGAAIFIKAFNAMAARRRLRALSWSATGPQAESFPLVGG